MAYPDQIKCNRCGKSIPPMPEDSDREELLCDSCYESEQVKAAYENSECPDCGTAIPVNVAEGEACRDCGHVFYSEPPEDYWSEDPDHPVADWKYEVANDDTRQGYHEWVKQRKDEADQGDYCPKCGCDWIAHNDDGSCVDEWAKRRSPTGPGYTEDI